MEKDVREIVSSLGINVATKKLICQEYCKLKKVNKLSSSEKKEIHNVISCLIEELVANPEPQVLKKDSGIYLSSSESNTLKNDSLSNEGNSHLPVDDVKENYEINDSEANRILNDEFVSSVKDLLSGCKKSKSVIKNISPLKKTKKRRLKRIKSSDVLSSIIDSDFDYASPRKNKSPEKTLKMQERFIYEDSPPRRQRCKKRKSEEVVRSILDSDSDDDDDDDDDDDSSPVESSLSPKQTPSKFVNDSNLITCEDSPLFQHRPKLKRKILFCESESESDEGVENNYNEINTEHSNSPQSPLKKQRVQTDSESEFEGNSITATSLPNSASCSPRLDICPSDSDSEDDFRDNALIKAKDTKINSSFRKKDSKSKNSEWDSRNYDDLKQCRVVVDDCMKNLNSSHESRGRSKSAEWNNKKIVMSGLGAAARKRKLSSSGDDLNDLEFSCKFDKGGSHQKKMKIYASNCDSDPKSSSDLDTSQDESSSHPSVLPVKEDIKKEKHVKQDLVKTQSKVLESKELRNLRAICRRIGVVLRNTMELKDCNTDKEKIGRIKTILHEKGMKGRPSMKKADQFNLERELKELGVDNNGTVSRSPLKGSRKRARRGQEISSEDSPPVAACDDFSHMKDIFCADDLSD